MYSDITTGAHLQTHASVAERRIFITHVETHAVNTLAGR